MEPELNTILIKLALTVIIITAIVPVSLITSTFPLTAETAYLYQLLTIQTISISFVLVARSKAKSQSLRLFWLYLIPALLSAFLIYFVTISSSTISSILAKDFLYLFVFFFTFLAIETNPHLSKTPLNRFTSGRLPSLVFSVLLFTYIILLPAHFNEADYFTGKLSILFQLVMSSVLLFRLLENTLESTGAYWKVFYGLIALGVSSIVIKNGLLLNKFHFNIEAGNLAANNSRLIAPYIALIIASYFSIQSKTKLTASNHENKPVLFILLLTLTFIFLHAFRIEFSHVYLVDSHFQLAVFIAWVVFAFFHLYLYSSKALKKISSLDNAKVRLQTLTQQQRAQLTHTTTKLVNSEEKAIVRASNNAILTTNTTGKILSANPAAVQMFQSLEKELINLNVKSLFSENENMHFFFDFNSNVYALQRNAKGISLECNCLRRDNIEFPVQAELQWAEREDQPLIVITFINLTERKLAEKQTLELKDKFIANISHEFRTPLTIINGIIDRHLVNTPNAQEQEDLSTAKRNGLRLVRMVEQLLELSRLSDDPRLSLSHYRLSTLMAMPIDSFSKLATQCGLSFESTIDENLWLECDAQAFEKIIFNLIANAIKYTPKQGKISIFATLHEDDILLEVSDTGIGIDEQSQGKIFERFQRANDEENHATFGVGIGLSLVNELVKAHNWRISLTSEKGVGSKFSLFIPKALAQSSEHTTSSSLSEQEVSSLLIERDKQPENTKAHSQKVVLVIEDNLDMQSHIKKVIEQQHHCMLAASGELGVELAIEYIPDLIVCDLMLTGIDGFEVLKQVKQNELTAHIPIILLTARSDLDSRLQGLNLNADEYLSKPFNQEELLVRIGNLINSREILQRSYIEKYQEKIKSDRKEDSKNKLTSLTQHHDITENVDERFIQKLESFIASNYTESTLDLKQMANFLAMSERQLQRKIKVLLGTTPNNYLKEFRLEKAKSLLSSGSQVGLIAMDIGFSSQTYFGKCFKESFGCTPKQYQQQQMGK